MNRMRWIFAGAIASLLLLLSLAGTSDPSSAQGNPTPTDVPPAGSGGMGFGGTRTVEEIMREQAKQTPDTTPREAPYPGRLPREKATNPAALPGPTFPSSEGTLIIVLISVAIGSVIAAMIGGLLRR